MSLAFESLRRKVYDSLLYKQFNLYLGGVSGLEQRRTWNGTQDSQLSSLGKNTTSHFQMDISRSHRKLLGPFPLLESHISVLCELC
jgi:hypothetical protein